MAGRRMSRLRDVLGSRTGAILTVVVLCSLLLSSCGDIGETLADLFHLNGNGNGNGDAEAQEGERRIETFVQVSNFELVADTEPGIVIDGDTTRYNIQSNASLRFNEETIALEENDVVIERPAAGVVTVIRDNS